MSEKSFEAASGDVVEHAASLARRSSESAPTLDDVKVLQARLEELTPPHGYEVDVQPLIEAAVRSDRSLGPLPLPQFLREYEEICPGAADLMFQELKKQGDHRRAIESEMVKRQNIRADRGQVWAGCIVFSALLAAIAAIAIGQPGAGVGLFSGALVSIVLGFLGSSGRLGHGHEAKASRIANSSDSSVEMATQSKRSRSTN